MGAWLGTIAGLAVASFGFGVMRDPMKLLWLSPGSEGYYQRVVLDKGGRIPLRVLGALVSVFGLVILTAGLSSFQELRPLAALSDAFVALLWVLFLGAWCVGIVIGAVQLLRGQTESWFQFWKRSILLGPIAVYPARTPAMDKEARRFTIVFLALVVIAVAIGLWLR